MKAIFFEKAVGRAVFLCTSFMVVPLHEGFAFVFTGQLL
jgi:hypothetical protein